ncbi:uncharacterized protein LOC110683914 [Chenopodium quinoa]|uniref:uncharacterized protein LOC110683914 n=1 Tax=Chenopodium quinoa TaxID=63459 RepID=UPI000B77A83A|nr:uncharacterized protein LOC110683914 [Chenopodium quinoa]
MADELIDQCANLRINDLENEIVDLGDVEDGESEARVSLMLVGKLISDRTINVEAFKRTMIHAWAVSKRLVIRVIGANLFAFQFFHWKDRKKVLEGRQWCFENNLLLLKEVKGDEQPTEVVLTHSPFWVRLENLPFNRRSNVVVAALTASMGELMEVEDDDLGLDKYRRVKLNLDVTKPLRRFLNMKGK